VFTRLTISNVLRNKLRTLLTLAAIALPIFVFTIARSFVDNVNEFFKRSDEKMRVAVHQKITFTSFLPQRIRGEIEDMAPDGYIKAICRTTWFGGRVEGEQMMFPNMGVDKDTFHIVYDEFGMTDEEVDAFQNERRGAVIAPMLAKMMGWKLGDRVTLKGEIPPWPELEFIIVSIPEGLDTGPWLYFGLDYYNEVWEQMTGESVGVHNFWLRCASTDARDWALTQIDPHYANSQHETRTELESTFIQAFLTSGGDWIGLVWSVGQLILFVAIAVAFNTMSMAYRERTRELAAMRALGFSSGHIIRMLLVEGLLLGMLGGLLGVGPLWALTNAIDIPVPGAGSISIQHLTALLAFGVAVACGVAAALVPALMAGYIRVAPALRKVA
jgi:putative ABC transport system permease protein